MKPLNQDQNINICSSINQIGDNAARNQEANQEPQQVQIISSGTNMTQMRRRQ